MQMYVTDLYQAMDVYLESNIEGEGASFINLIFNDFSRN